MPASCKCCTNTESAELNKLLAAGGTNGTNRFLAERFKVSTMSVQRHRINCLRFPRRAERSARPVAVADRRGAKRNAPKDAGDAAGRCAACGIDASTPDQTALLRRAERLLHNAEAIVAKAVEDGDSRLVLQGIDRARSSMELMMKATGLIGSDGTTVNVDARRQSVELFAELSLDDLRALAALGNGKALPPGDVIDAEVRSLG